MAPETAVQLNVAAKFDTAEELNPDGILHGGAGVAKFEEEENGLELLLQTACT